MQDRRHPKPRFRTSAGQHRSTLGPNRSILGLIRGRSGWIWGRIRVDPGVIRRRRFGGYPRSMCCRFGIDSGSNTCRLGVDPGPSQSSGFDAKGCNRRPSSWRSRVLGSRAGLGACGSGPQRSAPPSRSVRGSKRPLTLVKHLESFQLVNSSQPLNQPSRPPRTIFGQNWAEFGPNFGKARAGLRRGRDSGSICGRRMADSGLTRGRLGVDLGSTQGRFGVDLRSTCGRFSIHSGSV